MVNLNGHIFSALPPELEQVQRAFFYGDGLFETIRSYQGQLPFWDWHLDRLQRGMDQLGLEWPDGFSSHQLLSEIQKMGVDNSRIRITIWRSAGGLYMPLNHQAQFLISTQDLPTAWQSWPAEGLKVCFCDTVRMPIDQYAGLKWLGGMRYVAAAREVQQKGVQDGLLFNSAGRICEAVSSNLYWVSDGRLFYPTAGEGQVAGTFQAYLTDLLIQNGWNPSPKRCLQEDILQADEVFFTNAIQGIRWVSELDGRKLTNRTTSLVYELFKQDLAQKLNWNGYI
ncbi:MAG TPA: aminotransferase class IV [Saprospiraceae bacterium]|nr:aminotransferase class IV [Saprospiraceae bacterium]